MTELKSAGNENNGFYILSSSELEYEQKEALRQTRIQRILQVREQGRLLAKERRNRLSGNIERFEKENLASEKENWLREKAQSVSQMQAMFEHLRLNAGESHRKAHSVSTKTRKRAAKLNRYKEKIALATQERYDAALADVNKKRRDFSAGMDEFKDRRAKVKEIELNRAQERIAAYFGSKKEREEKTKAQELELLRLLGQEARNFSSSHLHELGIPVEVRRHEDPDEEDANVRALEFNEMLRRREEASKTERATALLREAERTHAAAQFVRAREMGKEVNKKLSNLWLADRQVKIKEFLQHQEQRVKKREMSKTEKLEKEIEDIFHLKVQEDDGAEQYATADELRSLNWSSTLPKQATDRISIAESLRSRRKEQEQALADEAKATGTSGSNRKSEEKKPPINISIPKGLKKRTPAKKKQEASEDALGGEGTATPGEGSRRIKRAWKPKSAKKKAKKSGKDPRLSKRGLKDVEGYLNEKDPLNLQQLAEDISLLTSSVLTDATELAREDERFMKQSEGLFSDNSTVMTLDDLSNETEKLLGSSFIPSTSENSSDPSFLNFDGSSKSSPLEFPELKAIDDLLNDSFFSLSALEDSSNRDTESKSSKSSPFTLQTESEDKKSSQDIYSPSSSSSSVLPLGGNKDKDAQSASSSILDTSDDDLIEKFIDNFTFESGSIS